LKAQNFNKALIKTKPTQKLNLWVGKKIAMKKKNYRFLDQAIFKYIQKI
jgi:hypothetical protein